MLERDRADEFVAQLSHAASVMITLMDQCVFPTDLVPLPASETAGAARKNLKELVRESKRQAALDAGEATVTRFATATWP